MVQKKSRAKKTPAERNRELEHEAAARGFWSLTTETLASLAQGTAVEAADLLEVSRRGPAAQPLWSPFVVSRASMTELRSISGHNS
jgi:hypothetical protein